MSRENAYQARLIRKLNRRYPGCVILKNDSSYLQGIPDLLVLIEDFWAMLETKGNEFAAEQPNQRYYVDLLDRMSFAAFINPSNEMDVLDALQHAYESCRSARVS